MGLIVQTPPLKTEQEANTEKKLMEDDGATAVITKNADGTFTVKGTYPNGG